MLKEITLLAALAVVAGLLSACQVNPLKPDVVATEGDIAKRDAKLAALKPWRALGSLVVDSEAKGLINASFAWDASATGFDIRLIGPLGLKTYRVVEEKNLARLYGDGNEVVGQSAEKLLRDEIGVIIPLADMQDWVVGLPGTGQKAERDSAGRLSKMSVTKDDDTNWLVNFKRYRQVDDLQLPATILVSGDGVEIRLSVRKWTRPEVAASDRLMIPGIGS